MKKNPSSQSAFFNSRLLLGLALCSAGIVLAIFSFAGIPWHSAGSADQRLRDMPVAGGKADDLDRMEQEWYNRITYPTGIFNPAWVRRAADHDALIPRRIPLGVRQAALLQRGKNAPAAMDVNAFTALGPAPERMTGCTGCYNYRTTEGRINTIAIDPTTTTNGSIVAYAASVGGGVWKTTNCCSAATTLDGAHRRPADRHDQHRHG